MKKTNFIDIKTNELNKQKKIDLSYKNKFVFNNHSFIDKEIYIYEFLDTHNQKIIYDGEDVFLIKKTESENSFLKEFNEKYSNDFFKFVKYFEKVPFSIWAFVKEDTFYFHDMNINSRWTPPDILEESLNKFNLNFVPVIYKGIYEETLIKDLIENTNKKIVVKIINDFDSLSRDTFLISKEIINKPNKKISKKTKTELKEKISLIAGNDILTEYYYDSTLKRLGINKKTASKREILNSLVNDEIKYFNSTFEDLAKKYEVDKEYVKKKFKGIYANKIRKVINI